MLKPIIISFKLITCQLLYLTNTYKPREILLTIVAIHDLLYLFIFIYSDLSDRVSMYSPHFNFNDAASSHSFYLRET